MKANTLYMLFPFVRYTLQHVQTMRPDGTLRQKASSLSREYALPLTMQLVNALAYCHSKGVLHRNLKPKHILLQMKSVSVDESGNDFDLQDAHLYLSDFALMRSITKPEKPLTAEVWSCLSLRSCHIASLCRTDLVYMHVCSDDFAVVPTAGDFDGVTCVQRGVGYLELGMRICGNAARTGAVHGHVSD